jgi:hypothetical protein
MDSDPMRTAREKCGRAFAFLEFDHGCRCRGRYLDHWGFELYYWNKTTGVRVLCTLRDPLLIWICRLPKEGFPPRADDPFARSRIEWYEIGDIKAVITGREPADPYLLQLSFEELAEDFRAHAEPLLRGDFALLGSVESRVVARRKAVEDQR